jgi:LDH2 family malate/lactate/ureidoglycolate dehydrogenase
VISDKLKMVSEKIMDNKHTYQQLYNFITSLFISIGCKKEDAETVAEVLMAAELRGIPSHGLMRVSDYISLWKAGRINLTPDVKIIHETPSTLTVDADNGFGMIAAKKTMQFVIEKAKNIGMAWASVINSNHYGIAGFYSLMAAEKQMIGISGTNANPLVSPTWSISRMLGTNPLAVAIPSKSYPPFVADFATSPIARGKLALMEKEGKTIDLGFVQDKDGNPSRRPEILKEGGAIVTLGGDYEHGGHKGYCMSAIIDIFSSVLGGANFGPFVPPQVSYIPIPQKQVGKGLGHFFAAYRADAFRPAEEFLQSMDEWITTFKQAKPDTHHEKVIIPGEPEYEKTNYHKEHGISVKKEVLTDLVLLSHTYNVINPFE